MSKKPSDFYRTLAQTRHFLRKINHLEQPAIPELSFKPDFMAKFENKLVFFEIAFLRRTERPDWKTLRLIEHVFELKLFFGNDTVCTLLILDPHSWKPYCLELLQGFYDRVIFQSEFEQTEGFLARAKTGNFRLWNLERDFQRSRFTKLAEMSLEQFRFSPVNSRVLKTRLFRQLSELGYQPDRNFPIRNLKNYYLTLDMKFRYYFDFRIGDCIVDLRTFRRINDFKLQNLMIKSRLIRYKKEQDRIEQARFLYKMILLVNGSLTGPAYDKMRYIKMLTASGWDVYPTTIMDNERMIREALSYA